MWGRRGEEREDEENTKMNSAVHDENNKIFIMYSAVHGENEVNTIMYSAVHPWIPVFYKRLSLGLFPFSLIGVT